MKKQLADVVKESTATTGTGTVTLVQATGWARFADRFANNDRVYYSIRDGSNWEIGHGTYLTANQLARTTILGTLNAGVWTDGGSPLNLSGVAVVRVVAPERLFTNLWRVEPQIVTGNTQMVAGGCYIVADAGLTLTLPASPDVGDRVQIMEGSTSLLTGTVVAPGADVIHGTAGNMNIDVGDFAFAMVYVDATFGWKVI